MRASRLIALKNEIIRQTNRYLQYLQNSRRLHESVDEREITDLHQTMTMLRNAVQASREATPAQLLDRYVSETLRQAHLQARRLDEPSGMAQSQFRPIFFNIEQISLYPCRPSSHTYRFTNTARRLDFSSHAIDTPSRHRLAGRGDIADDITSEPTTTATP